MAVRGFSKMNEGVRRFWVLKRFLLILGKFGGVALQPLPVKNNSITIDLKLDKNKKIFLIAAIIFLIILFIIAVDIASRTTFPGPKGNVEEAIPVGEAFSSLTELEILEIDDVRQINLDPCIL